VQMDELWSFVDDKGHKQGVWLALDVETREIVGGHIGDRAKESALALWQSMPGVYRQCARLYTDHIWHCIHYYNEKIRLEQASC
jgi:insertion element IS1 protein InsB